MGKQLLQVVMLLCGLGGFQTIYAADNWGYTQQNGPEQWSRMGYPLCESGRHQSPVDILQVTSAPQDQLNFHYSPTEFQVKQDNHNLFFYVQDDAPKNNNYIEFNGQHYYLKSFHFHNPAEHEINSKRYAMEGHFIHQSTNGDYLVIGVFFRLGASNPLLSKTIRASGEKTYVTNIAEFMPPKRIFFSYQGSLTTPPCAEGITWVVMAQPQSVSAAERHQFEKRLGTENSRPPQPLDGRRITQTNF
jgi:carbonic anhydrase